MVDVPMPTLADEEAEGVVTSWMVDEGARVRAGQLIAEAQSEKVSFDIEAPVDGVVVDLVAINEPVAQGDPVCRIREQDDAGPTHPDAGPRGDVATSPGTELAPERVPASPAARRLARELGVELAAVRGSGPGGRITEGDVRSAEQGGDGGADEPDATSREGRTEAGAEATGMTGLRAVIARNMRTSHASTAPVTLTATADVTDRLPDRVTARVLQAVARALADHQALNGRRDGDTFHPSETVDVSLAIQTDEGLVAPVVRDPAGGDLATLSAAIADLAERARGGALTSDDHRGGTFSVTNLGPWGVEAFTPIINLPQVAILGVGAIRDGVAVVEGQLVARQHMALSLTFDHAFVDGVPAAAFLARVRALLEESTAD